MTRNRLNLRKMIAAAICLAGSVTLFAQETGVVINGVTWATRNVDAPKTFVTNPEDAGMFYQWNSKIGWSAADPLTASDSTSTWNSSWDGNGDTTWKTTNDPSPSGWRVPTKAEIESLLNTTFVTMVSKVQNGTNGYLFTDKATGNSIFLPAAGYRNINSGFLNDVGTVGDYWSSTAQSSNNANNLYFSSFTKIENNVAVFGMSIRPVKDPSVTTYNITATAGTGGSISPSGTINVEEGKDTTFTFSANSGYEISQVLIDNLNNFPAVAAGSYTFNNVTANHTIEVYFSPITGISEARAEKIQIFPNPTNGQLRVSGYILDGKDIQIYDVVGQVVFSSHLSNLSPETTIDISHLANGMYFVKLKTEKGIVTKKFVKE